MKCLIDADIILWRASALKRTSKQNTEYLAGKAIHDVMEATKASSYMLYFTGSNNFRKEINPNYKANRKDVQLPEFYQAAKEYLMTHYDFEIAHGCEADDLLGIAQTQALRSEHQTDNTIICSLDKDLQQIPGWHYSWKLTHGGEVVRDERIWEVEKLEATQFLYKQMLIGDNTDNIFGVPRIGKIKAAEIIDPIDTEAEMLYTVRQMYDDDGRFLMNARCLHIWQELGIMWDDQPHIREMLSDEKEEGEGVV